MTADRSEPRSLCGPAPASTITVSWPVRGPREKHFLEFDNWVRIKQLSDGLPFCYRCVAVQQDFDLLARNIEILALNGLVKDKLREIGEPFSVK